MPWKRMLAYITGSVNEDLLRRIESLREENRVLRHQIQKRILLTDHERRTLADKAIALGKLMADTVTIVKPETILKWHRRLVAQKFDGSRFRKRQGRPPTKADSEELVVHLAKENPAWVMIELPVRSPIWGITAATKRWATSCSATAWGQHPSAGRTPHVPVSFASTSTCSGRPISSRRRYGRAGD